MAFKTPDKLIMRLADYGKGRNKEIPDWDLYDTDEEAMAAAEEMMLEDYGDTPWGDDWKFGDVVKDMQKRHPHIPLERVRSLIADDFPADDNENYNQWFDKMQSHYENN